jgi:hypothetical protein
MLGALIASGAQATVPELVPVQGVLTDGVGDFIDGATDMVFAIYDSETAVSAIYTESHTGGDAIDVDEGFFTVYLGSITAIDPSVLAAASELWLGVTVGTDAEMNRTQLASVPYALEALTCERVGALTETDINNNFLPSSYTPAWGDLTGVPAGFADGTDDEGFSTEAELTALLDDNYAAAGHNHDAAYAPISHNHDAAYVNEGQANSITTSMITNGTIDGADLEANFTYTGDMTVTGTMSVTGTEFGMARVYLGSNGTLFTHPGSNVSLVWDSAGRVLTFDNNSGVFWDVAMSGVEDIDYGTANELKAEGRARDVGNGGTLTLDGNNQDGGFAYGFQVDAADEGAAGPGFTFSGAGWGGGLSGLVIYWY